MSKSQSDEDSYTEYEEIYKRIKDENESYLTMFEKYLENQGLKAQTIRRHVFNADVLINAFLLDHELCRMEEGIIIIDSFMHFFMRKCMWSSRTSIKTTAASIKKFYKCMADNGKIGDEDYRQLLISIKAGMPVWLDEYEEYENQLYGSYDDWDDSGEPDDSDAYDASEEF